MGKKPKAWYAWHDATNNGGIFRTWSECEAASRGKPGEKHKGFDTKEEAWNFAFPGTPMPDKCDVTSASSVIQTDMSKPTLCITADTGNSSQLSETASLPQIDAAKISRVEPSDKVNRFCANYGFEHLSKDQRRAVQATDGKVLLFAVPGSGKTTVLIARIGYMIHACGINPGSIVSLTFTKASAAEMKDRYQKRFPNDTALPQFRTIHSFAFSVIIPMLRRVGYSIPRHMISDFSETAENGRKKRSFASIIFSEVNERLRPKSKEFGKKNTVLLNGRKDREALQTAITGIKNTKMTREQLRGKTIHLNNGQDLPIDRAFDIYSDLCRKYHCMDFDDMLIYALEGLQKHPEVLLQLQRHYRYWSIDESQDNSPLQHELLQLLVGNNGNLFMVGDDDQSIYAFRGAKPRLFQQFGMESDVTVLTIGSNYRSSSGIVKTAEAFICENPSHQDKQMHAAQENVGCIRFIYDLHTEKQQYDKIVEAARACKEKELELAVLYRENVSALPVMFWLEKHGVSFITEAKLTELLQSPYISRMLNLLRFAVHQNSYSLCMKVHTDLSVFPSDVVNSSWRRACEAAPERNVLELLAVIDDRDYASRLELLAEAAGATPYDAVRNLMQALGINPKSQSERMQVNAILSTCALYSSIPELFSAIEAMKHKLNDTGEEDDDGEVSGHVSESESQKSSCNAVTLTTMHSAKGLEFDHVMIIDFLAPPDIPFNPTQLVFDDPEEPCRLFYVAITRAKRTLDILTVQSYHGSIEVAHPFIRWYAAICDQEEVLTEYASSGPKPTDCAEIKAYGKYYGVPVGRTPGVYTSWSETQAQIEHFPHGHSKSFSTWEEAATYAYPNGIPDTIRPVDISVFKQYLVTNPTLRANWPQDIHPCVTRGILELLHTNSLMSLDPIRCSRLKMDYLTSHSDAYDYSGMRALAYTVSYLPPNYYKVWTPLWKLLEKKQLPYQAKILELGAGPGTSGLALLDFYGKLAVANPDIQFSVEYTAVERELSFQKVFDYLMDAMASALPTNLFVRRKLVHADAFDFINKITDPAFNIVLESNMLNQDENIPDEALSTIGEGFARSLCEEGIVILIEPGKRDQLPILEKVVSHDSLKRIVDPQITSVDASSITLVEQCLKTGIRRKAIAEHWYSVVVAERKVS